MATLCKTFPTTESALDAAEALSAAGVPAGDVGVLTGRHHDDHQRRDGDRYVEATDDDSARRLLTRAQVPDQVAQRMVRHLHEGEAIMFVQLAQVDLGTAAGLICQRAVAS